MTLKHSERLPGVTVVGKIVLADNKKGQPKAGKKRNFKMFFGGCTLGDILKAQGIKLA